MASWLTNFENWCSGRTGLLVTAAGVTLRRVAWHGAAVEHHIRWPEIQRIVAFKRDCYTVDSIRMLIVTSAGVVEIGEDVPGWDDWTAALPERLPGAKRFEEWFFAVAFPAFAENATVLYPAQEPGA